MMVDELRKDRIKDIIRRDLNFPQVYELAMEGNSERACAPRYKQVTNQISLFFLFSFPFSFPVSFLFFLFLPFPPFYFPFPFPFFLFFLSLSSFPPLFFISFPFLSLFISSFISSLS